MQASQIPAKFTIPFASSAGASYTRTIPLASQIGITGGAASLTDGFPPLCFLPVASGGIPPFGQDFNGLLKQITQWSQWQAAGALPVWDSAFSTAVGGYPQGAILASVTSGQLWLNLADNNATNPDGGMPANWVGLVTQTNLAAAFQQRAFNFANDTGSTNALVATLTVAPASLAVGMSVDILVANTNTGASTLNLNGFGAFQIVRPSGSTLYANDLIANKVFTFKYVGSSTWELATASLFGSQAALTAALNIYVNASTGSDSNPGTSALPFATLQTACNYVAGNINTAGQSVTINCSGAFTAGVASARPFTGAGSVTFAFTSGSSVASNAANTFEAIGAGTGFSITTTSGTAVVISSSGTGVNSGAGIIASDGAEIVLGNVNLGSCTYTNLSAAYNGQIKVNNSITFSGTAAFACYCQLGGLIDFLQTGSTISVAMSSPTFTTAAMAAVDRSLIVIPSSYVVFSGSATGKRYSVADVSLIDTAGGGASFIPGTTAGTAVNSFNYQ